ncbi:MAG: divalent-cation tolerance protein CutA [Thermoanaerobaculia bacterium]
MAANDVIVMLTSVGTEEQALDIGEALVRRRFATCVNLVPSARSIYRWKGKVCEDGEFLLIIKTVAREYPAVARTIREINSYELPEILSFGIRDGDPHFRKWVAEMVRKPKARTGKKKSPASARRRAAPAKRS